MKEIKCRIAIYLIFSLVVTVNAFAADITAIGEGHTKQEAINNATRAAVEQALGSYIDSKTLVNNGELIYDKVASASAGYVKGYDILTEGQDPANDKYKVKIRVSIDDFKLKNAAAEFIKDPRAQRAFQETKFDERRVIVVYKPQTGLDLPYDSKAVKTVMGLVEDKLAGYGFRVFLQDQLKRIKDRQAELVIDEETALGLARQEEADAVVMVNFDAGFRETPDGFLNISASVNLKAFDATTGELFANAMEKDKTVSRGGSYGYPKGIARVAEKAGPRAVDRLTEKIVERFSTKRAKFVVIVFKNISGQQQEKIEDVLDDTGLKYKISRQTGSYMEIEVFSDGDPTAVRGSVRKSLKKAGLSLSSAEVAGSRVVFDGTRGN